MKVFRPLTHFHTLTVIISGRQYSQSASTSCFWWAKGDLVRYRARVRPCELAGRWHDVMRAVQGVERRGGGGELGDNGRAHRDQHGAGARRTLQNFSAPLMAWARLCASLLLVFLLRPPVLFHRLRPGSTALVSALRRSTLQQAPQRERGVATREGVRLAPQ